MGIMKKAKYKVHIVQASDFLFCVNCNWIHKWPIYDQLSEVYFVFESDTNKTVEQISSYSMSKHEL